MFYVALMVGLGVGALYVAWWIFLRRGRDLSERHVSRLPAPMTIAAASRLADQKLARQWLRRDFNAILKRIRKGAAGRGLRATRRVALVLPTEIQAEITAMAQADSRTFEAEVAYLVRRGLRLPRRFSIADQAFVIAELAYLRSEEGDDAR